jgi:radical SAM superfamily enzyme YgiQ (UPF0313 family)
MTIGRTMQIQLISPSIRDPRNIGKFFPLPQMALALLAGLSPPDIEICIIDELLEPIDFERTPDLVGISVNTETAVRGYEIAEEFRNRGVPVVLGGIHATVAYNEAIQHADSLVIGEAEGVWAKLLRDFRIGSLQKFYRSYAFPSLANSCLPRRDLFREEKYDTINLVQVSRGCPYACQFCSVSSIYGKKIRLRSINDVIAEVTKLRGDKLFFVDDNIVGKSLYSKQLFTRLTPLRRKWIGQAPVTVADDVEMLKILQRSGCQGLFVGFETESAESLNMVGKLQNIRNDYFETIRRLHDSGISILGSFIVGFDNDDKSCFEAIVEFAYKSGIEVMDVSTLTPYPGTILYKKMKEENRLLENAWWLKYNANDVVYKPKLMSREELYHGRLWVIKEFYRLRPTLRRCVSGLARRSLFGNFINWKVNMGYRKYSSVMTGKDASPFAKTPLQSI